MVNAAAAVAAAAAAMFLCVQLHAISDVSVTHHSGIHRTAVITSCQVAFLCRSTKLPPVCFYSCQSAPPYHLPQVPQLSV